MMSTLEAAQQIRSLPSDDIVQSVETPFPIGKHKDLNSTETTESDEATEQLVDPPMEQSEGSEVIPDGTECAQEDIQPQRNGSENNGVQSECEEKVQVESVSDTQEGDEKPPVESAEDISEDADMKDDTESVKEESNGVPDTPEDISEDKQDTSDTPACAAEEISSSNVDGAVAPETVEDISEDRDNSTDCPVADAPDGNKDISEDKEDTTDSIANATEGNIEDASEAEAASKQDTLDSDNAEECKVVEADSADGPEVIEDISNEKFAEAPDSAAVHSVTETPEESEDAAEDKPTDASPMEIHTTNQDISEETPEITPTAIPDVEVSVAAETKEDDALKPSNDDVIDLDDMLKEIGVDNIDTEESKDQPEISSNTDEKVTEEKLQEIEEDDDVVMTVLDEATPKPPTEEKSNEKEKDEEIEEDFFKECDELLKSIADGNDLEHSDADHAISLDEDSSDASKKPQETEEEKVETNEAEAAQSLTLEKETESKESPQKTDDAFEADTADKSDDMANSSDDVLIIDDEAETSDVAENTAEPESSVKESVPEQPEVTSDEKPEEMKATEMDIEEETDGAVPPKDDPPKSSPSEEPIPIDDDDLSIDKAEMNELREDSAKKRPSSSIEYEAKFKRRKMSDASEKDTDSQSSMQSSKRGVDLQDSTSRQSDRDDSDVDSLSHKSHKDITNKEFTQAEKDVGSLLTPLPKKISMEFVTRFKKPFQDMSHADLEDFVLQKIAELITHKSEYSEMRKKLEKQEEMIGFYRTKLSELSKNFHDLEVVYKRVQQELDNRNSGYVQIPKITRAVGLQVSVSNSRKQHMSSSLAAEMQQQNARAQQVQEAKRGKPNQRFTPMRPPMSEADQKNLDALEQRKRQEMMQQAQQKLALNAVSSANTVTSIAQRNPNIVMRTVTPKPTQKVVTPPQPYVVKRTAVRTSTVTSTVMTKTVSPSAQAHQQRVIISPSTVGQQHSQQSPQQALHKVSLQPQRMNVVTPPKKQVVVDLTDEDDNAKTKVSPQAKPSVPQTLLNGNMPALVAIPSSSNTKPTTKFVMVQQMTATNGQMPKTMPNKYGTSNRMKMSIAPKPADVHIRSVLPQQQQQQQQQQSLVRRPPMVSQQIATTAQMPPRPVKLMAPQRSHPAPLPPFQNQPSQYGMKRIPTRPVIRIKNDEKQGIVISWTMDDLTDDHEEIRDYQIYAYQESSAAPSTDNWRLVGDVKSMMLPMAVTLSQFQEGQRYWFAVRARDVHDRCGMFSVPRTW